ncbi:MAG: FecR family protein [Fimbriimonadaceae bacterium]
MRKLLLLMIVVFVPVSQIQAQKLGLFRSIKERVLISKIGGDAFGQARLNQSVFDSQSIRTLKQSSAAILFVDGFELRVSQRTELILHSSEALRKLKLGAGAIWVKVKPGVRVEVETPVLTAAVRGTEFEINEQGELRVYSGIVEGSNEVGRWSVTPGNMLHFENDQWKVVPLAPWQLPRSHGGPTKRWHEENVLGRENLTSSERLERTRRSDLSSFIAAGGENYTRGTAIQARFRSETEKATLPLVLAGLMILADQGTPTGVASLDSGLELGHPSLFNTRLSYEFARRNTIVTGEAIAGSSLTKADWFHCLDSILFAERAVNQELIIRAGRFRLGGTRPPLDLFNQGLWSGGVSGVSIQVQKGPMQAEFAYAHDVDPIRQSTQSGLTATADVYLGNAVIGVTGLVGTRNQSNSLALSSVVSLLDNNIQFYGMGQFLGSDGGKAVTLGLEFPHLYERWGITGLIEYQYASRYGSGWTLYASLPITDKMNLSLQWGMQVRGRSHCGLGVSLKF